MTDQVIATVVLVLFFVALAGQFVYDQVTHDQDPPCSEFADSSFPPLRCWPGESE